MSVDGQRGIPGVHKMSYLLMVVRSNILEDGMVGLVENRRHGRVDEQM